MNQKTVGLNWALTILLLILVFPVGVPMAVCKGLGEKQRYLKNYRKPIAAGAPFLGLGLIYLVMLISGNTVAATAFCVFFLWGFPPVLTGLIMKYRGGRLNKYGNVLQTVIVSGYSAVTFGDLAGALKESPERVERTLVCMANEGNLPGFSLDHRTGRVPVLSQIHREAPQAKPDVPCVSMVCERCGGVTKIPQGTRGICDYCDSPL